MTRGLREAKIGAATRSSQVVEDVTVGVGKRTLVEQIQPVEAAQVARMARGPRAGGTAAPAHVVAAAHRGGQALPAGVRALFEPRFHHDFSDVRVHTDGEATAAAAAIDARAYTVGNDIVFGAGQYQPDARDGQRLIAHELTHVVQQRGGARAAQRAGGEPAGGEAGAKLARAVAQLAALHALVAPMAATSGDGAAQVAVLADGLARMRAVLAGGDAAAQARMLEQLAAHLPPGMVDGIDGHAPATTGPITAPISEAREPGVAMAGLAVSQTGDAAEQEAERVADAVMAGADVQVSAAPGGIVYRDGDGDGGGVGWDWAIFAGILLFIVAVLLALWFGPRFFARSVGTAISEASKPDVRPRKGNPREHERARNDEQRTELPSSGTLRQRTRVRSAVSSSQVVSEDAPRDPARTELSETVSISDPDSRPPSQALDAPLRSEPPRSVRESSASREFARVKPREVRQRQALPDPRGAFVALFGDPAALVVRIPQLGLRGDTRTLTAALQRLAAARDDDDLEEAAHAAIHLCVVHGVTTHLARELREDRGKERDEPEKPRDRSGKPHDDERSSPGASVGESLLPKAVEAPPKRSDLSEINDLGRSVVKPVAQAPEPKSRDRRAKKEPAVSDKGAGDHTFNDPFDVMVKSLEALRDHEKVGRVAYVLARLRDISKVWCSQYRDQLRAYFTGRAPGLIDANSLAFGLFSQLIRDLVADARVAQDFDRIGDAVDRMFAHGIVDPASLAEVSKRSDKDAERARLAWAYLQTYQPVVHDAVDALREHRTRKDGAHDKELQRLAVRCQAALIAEAPLPEDAIAQLRELYARLGADTFNRVFGAMRAESAKPHLSKDHASAIAAAVTGKNPDDKPSDKGGKGDKSAKAEKEEPKPDGKKGAGKSSGDGPAAPVLRGAFAPNALNIVHAFNHYHLLLQLPDHRIIDLDVPGDGSCFVHAAAWSDVLAADWQRFCQDPRNRDADLIAIRQWFTERLRACAPAEHEQMCELRIAIATELAAHQANYQDAIEQAIATMIDLARFENDEVPDALDWRFEGAGGVFGDVLAVFVSQHLPQVLDFNTNLEALVAASPLLSSAYIAAMRDDTRLWTGEAEVLALDAIRGQQQPIQVFLPSTMPLASMAISVDEVMHEDKGGKPIGGSPKGGAIAAPRFDYDKMSNAGARDVLLDDARTLLRELGWEAKGHICEYRPALVYGVDLHASLVGKGNAPGHINQVEFVIRQPEKEGGKKRETSVRWWYWIKLLDGDVRLAFSGNVGNGSDAAVKQAQSDENEQAYVRFLAGTPIDPGAQIARAVDALERGLTRKLKAKK
jgi:hypothetical protein